MGDPLVDNKSIYDLEYKFLHLFGYLMKIVGVLFIFGIIQNKPVYLLEFNFVVKIIISLFLIYRFNKYRKEKIQFTDLDRRVAFSAGIYIMAISFADLLNGYIEEIRAVITPYTQPIIAKIKKSILHDQEYAI